MPASRTRRRGFDAAPARNEWLVALVLGAASFAWSTTDLALPAFHPDETRLAREVATSAADPRYPTLLAHLARGAAAAAGARSPAEIVASGRVVSAAFGALALVACWRALRAALRPRAAVLGAAVVGASPLFVLDARTFAPDTASLALGLVAILSLARLVERPTGGRSLVLGTAIGLAVSVHYGGLLLVLVCLATPLVASVGNARAFLRRLAPAIAVAALVFAVVNAPLVVRPAELLSGWSAELRSLVAGDHLFVSVVASAGVFHLRSSLLPGVTTPVLVVAAIGVGVALRSRKTLSATGRLVVLYGGLALVIAELSPLKPLPGAARYVLPTLPAVGLGCGFALQALEDVFRSRAPRWLPAVAALVLLAAPLWASARLSRGLEQDTRTRADAWLAAHGGRVLRGPLSSARPADVPSIATVDLDAARRAGVTHVATSSFVYGTFARGSRLAGQADYVYERHARYQELFEYPFEEFAPGAPSLGWSQPTIRVLDIRTPRPPGRP